MGRQFIVLSRKSSLLIFITPRLYFYSARSIALKITFLFLVACCSAQAEKVIEYFGAGKYEEGERSWYYRAYDNTVEAVFDGEGNNLSASRYSAFGKRISDVGVSLNREAFQGLDYRKEANHYNLGVRNMDQDSGGWLQAEPKIVTGEPLLFSPYRYAFNNPALWTDSSGFAPRQTPMLKYSEVSSEVRAGIVSDYSDGMYLYRISAKYGVVPEAISQILYEETGRPLGSRGTGGGLAREQSSAGTSGLVIDEKANRLADLYGAMGEDMSRGGREGLPDGTHSARTSPSRTSSPRKSSPLADVMVEDMRRGTRTGLPEGTHEVFEFSEILTRGGFGTGGAGNALMWGYTLLVDVIYQNLGGACLGVELHPYGFGAWNPEAQQEDLEACDAYLEAHPDAFSTEPGPSLGVPSHYAQ